MESRAQSIYGKLSKTLEEYTPPTLEELDEDKKEMVNKSKRRKVSDGK